jgi:TatD DNase family protein
LLIDTHAHINLLVTDFDTPITDDNYSDIKIILDEAKNCGVTTIINVGTNLIESNNSVLLANKFSSIFAAIGIHPTDWHSHYKKDLNSFNRLLKENEKIVAIGECGLDLYHQKVPLEKQITLFHEQIEIALIHKKPLIIHSRDAYDQTLKILEEYHKEPINGVIHCFSYDYDFAQTVINWNFVLGIGGTITYPKNNELRTAVQKVDLSSIVLETDTPFLPMQSMRGKKNHPRYIVDIAQYLADLKEIEFDIVATQTTKTAKKLFHV